MFNLKCFPSISTHLVVFTHTTTNYVCNWAKTWPALNFAAHDDLLAAPYSFNAHYDFRRLQDVLKLFRCFDDYDNSEFT